MSQPLPAEPLAAPLTSTAFRPAAAGAPPRGAVRIHFPGLHALRFLAALAVVVHHTEQLKGLARLPSVFESPFVYGMGKAGVTLFFVLSGFLITYLLLAEGDRTGHIDVQRFYVRRMLRIWPLYYLVVGLSFFALPLILRGVAWGQPISRGAFWPSFALYILMLPNVAANAYDPVLGASQGWSIGVEEQFYLLWPVLVRRFRSRMPRFLAAVFVGKFAALAVVLALSAIAPRVGWDGRTTRWLGVAVDTLASWQIESMTMGAAVAWLAFTGRLHKAFVRFGGPSWQVAVAAVSLAVVPAVHVHLWSLMRGVAFAALIANVACNPRSILTIDNAAARYLGDLSYGIYMLHVIVIALVLRFCAGLPVLVGHGAALELTLYALCVGGTILAAAASYRFFEQPFLRLKARFAVVPSGGR